MDYYFEQNTIQVGQTHCFDIYVTFSKILILIDSFQQKCHISSQSLEPFLVAYISLCNNLDNHTNADFSIRRSRSCNDFSLTSATGT